MPRRILFASLFSILLFLTASSQVQNVFDSLSMHFSVRDSLFSGSQLYLHTDKTVYTGNENIWFTGYLLRAVRPLEDFHTMHVFLSHRITHQVVASEQFVMAQGLSAGSIFVADSFPAGEYNLVAYANTIAGDPYPQVFRQTITIRYGGGTPFRIELDDRGKQRADSIGFLAHVTNAAMLNATGASFRYSIMGDNKTVIRGNAVVSPFGEVELAIPRDSSISRFELQAAVQKDKASFAGSVPLSFLKNRLSFHWYPESGYWVDGLVSRTAFEVVDQSGKPASVSGQLLEDGRPVARFRSSAGGLGLLTITPVAGRVYSIKLEDSAREIAAARLPAVRSRGVVISVAEAVARDTMEVKVSSAGVRSVLYLLVHDYRQPYRLLQFMGRDREVVLHIPVSDLDAGPATLTVFDEAFRPLAERSFFKGFDSLAKVTIKADSTEYHRRAKLNLEVQVSDAAGNPLKAGFSVSIALSRRVDPAQFNDIVPYALFRNYTDMGLIPNIPAYAMGSREDLEMFLRVRCWTRYMEPVPDSSVAHIVAGRSLDMSGEVHSVRRKSLKKPVQLAVMNGASLGMLETDSSGHFDLDHKMTALPSGASLTLFVMEKNKEDFQIVVNHEADSVNAAIAKLDFPVLPDVKAVMPDDEEGLSQVKTLQAVVISSEPSRSEWGAFGQYESKTCSDYVCMYNILNCSNHRTGTPAVEGGVYRLGGREVVYHCAGRNLGNGTPVELLQKLKGRYYPKEFYISDYASFSPAEPEKYSTVYWSPQVLTDDQGRASVSFYTNDLTGAFLCVVEGLTAQGVVSGRSIIRVVE